MRNLYHQLAEICQKHIFQEKVLIMPAYSAGHMLIQQFVTAGHKALNLKPETLLGQAEKISNTMLQQKKQKLINENLANHLMLEMLKTISRKGRLTYFSRLEVTPGIARAVSNSVLELKMAGINLSDISEESFVSIDKGKDIKVIFEEYSKVLAENNYLDKADLLRLAAGINQGEKSRAFKESSAVNENNTVYIIPSNLKLQPLEILFLESILLGNFYYLLNFADLPGLTAPTNRLINQPAVSIENYLVEIQWTNQLAWLYDIKNLSASPSCCPGVDMFHAYGESCEVKEILRRIKEKKQPFDKVAVYLTSREPYTQYFMELAQQYGIPITFGEGINISNTRPGRFFYALMEWLKSDYNVTFLYKLIMSDDFKIPSDKKTPSKAFTARLLRSLEIGWGRGRYLLKLEKEIDNCLSSLKRKDEGKGRKALKEYFHNLIWVKEFMVNLLDKLPKPDNEGKIDYCSFVNGLVGIIEDYTNCAGEADEEAKNAIVSEFNSIAGSFYSLINIDEAILLLEDIVGLMRVSRSLPKPGCIHVDGYYKGLWLCRSSSFFVGLDAHRFPGQSMEDAVLLDTERGMLGKGLSLKKHSTAEKIYDMAASLASQEGTITLSYAAFDTVESREVFPSTLLLQVYRLITKDETRDYSQLVSRLGLKKAFVPQNSVHVLNEAEWWMDKILNGIRTKNWQDEVLKAYSSIKKGLISREQRMKSFNIFDGKIKRGPKTWNNSTVFSATQLESLSACPFNYFLRYILRIEPPDELTYDPGAWLDPAARGILLHRIYEEFYKRITERGEKPSFEKHLTLLSEIADEFIEEQKTEIPPPNEIVFDYESKEIMESSKIFLKSEEELSRESTACFFELSFGIRALTDEKLGKIGPVKIELPSERCFYLRGKIDRVDKNNDGLYSILDYKTGSTYLYDQYQYFKGGRQLQHTLYAIALEQILRDKGIEVNPVVKEAGYSFPTLKGEGMRIMRKQEDREKFYELLEILLELLSRGIFVMTDDEDDCRYCDYPLVCDRNIFKEEYKQVVENNSDEELELFRRLRDYA